MCGIVGIVAKSPVNQALYDALTVIQHRGQDAAGIMTCDENRVYLRKSNGLVRDVIREPHILRLLGTMGIGHVRYPTAGTQSSLEAQPLYVNSPYGLSIAHNGNLVNSAELEKDLVKNDLRQLTTESDSEILLNVFAHELQQFGKHALDADTLFKAVKRLHKRCVGAYAAVILVSGHGVLGIRDPHGIRPLVLGKRVSSDGDEYMLASECSALSALGYELEGDVAPGEAVYIDATGKLHRQQCAKNPVYSPCIFEYVYLARPDAVIDDILVYKVRLRLGEHLADKINQLYPEHDIDVVMPIPDTSRIAALPIAQKLGVKYREGFVKNRYIGRTFIMPGQALREKSVRQKLNPIGHEFKGKNVLLVDDSIVRGTTSKEIITMARDAGANKVYFASAAPPVTYPNVYGIDMPCAEDLIAHNRSVEEVANIIGADWLVYNDLAALVSAAQEGNAKIKRFEDSIFTGDYITGGVSATYLKETATKRAEDVKQAPDG